MNEPALLYQPEPEPRNPKADKQTRHHAAAVCSAAPRPRAQTLPGVTPAPSDEAENWQQPLWQEWRNTNDESYAERLFELIAETPAGHRATLINLLLGLGYGAVAGLLLALLGLLSTGASLESAEPLLLLAGGGALLGGGWVLLLRLTVQRRLTTQQWLAQLTANLTPNELGLLGVGLAFQIFGGLVGWTFGLLAGRGHVAGLVVLSIVLLTGLGARLVGGLLGFGRPPNPQHLHRYRKLWLWWRKRPLSRRVATALQLALHHTPPAHQHWAAALQQLQKKQPPSMSVTAQINRLSSADWAERFIAWHLLARSGGRGVAQLQPLAGQNTSPLRNTARQLLRAIAQETTAQLAHRPHRLLCPTCLAFFGPHPVTVGSGADLIFYGCRVCGQSTKFWEGEVVAVLDDNMGDEPHHLPGQTRLNWLTRRELFDFHTVEISQAGDEAVERLAVQVGNDTDPLRQPGYQQMQCVVRCPLSANTLRVLERTFGKVEQA